MVGERETTQTSVSPYHCKFFVLYVSNDFSEGGCKLSADALGQHFPLDADGRCPVSAVYTADRPACSAAETDTFIRKCDLMPGPEGGQDAGATTLRLGWSVLFACSCLLLGAAAPQ